MKSRFIFLFLSVSLLWILLILRAAYLQILPNQKLSKLQNRQFNTVVELNPRRGVIYDRNGVELAASVAAYSLYADPSILKAPKTTSRQLARLLRMNPSRLFKKLKDSDRKFVWIARRLNRRTKEKVEKLKIQGLAFVEESRRIFPHEKLLGQVLGFVGGEGQGLGGLEWKFDHLLHGVLKKVSLRRDAFGRPLLMNGRIFSESTDGADITLTIDSSLQYALEQELYSTVEKYQAKSAVGLILDANTSEILAMANVPTFNPNRPLRVQQEIRRNRAVTDPIEPGSTMKAFTIASGLRAGLIAPNTRFYCEDGEFKIGNRTIREADKKHKWEWLTVSEILAYSSNIGSSKIALKLGDERIEEGLRDFGFGDKISEDLPGESRGVVPTLPWREHLLANISFGHGLSATPLQVANAYAAIANGGVLHRPFIVKSIRNKETGDLEVFEEQSVHRVLSEKDAATMRLLLMGVTNEGGTGVNARIKGFSVAGKTGTAQKVNEEGRYSRTKFVSSFAGFVPANDPKYVIYIVVDEPKENYYGSEVAAPAFAKLAQISTRRAGLQPTLITQDDVLKSENQQRHMRTHQIARKVSVELDMKSSTVPDLRGLSLREALQLLKPFDLDISVHGHGRISRTEPMAGTSLEKGPLSLYLEKDSF